MQWKQTCKATAEAGVVKLLCCVKHVSLAQKKLSGLFKFSVKIPEFSTLYFFIMKNGCGS